MKTRPHPRIKAEDVPAPSRAEFEQFLKKIVSVPKAEINKRESEYARTKTKPRRGK